MLPRGFATAVSSSLLYEDDQGGGRPVPGAAATELETVRIAQRRVAEALVDGRLGVDAPIEELIAFARAQARNDGTS